VPGPDKRPVHAPHGSWWINSWWINDQKISRRSEAVVLTIRLPDSAARQCQAGAVQRRRWMRRRRSSPACRSMRRNRQFDEIAQSWHRFSRGRSMACRRIGTLWVLHGTEKTMFIPTLRSTVALRLYLALRFRSGFAPFVFIGHTFFNESEYSLGSRPNQPHDRSR
jgi:hypothetical protein